VADVRLPAHLETWIADVTQGELMSATRRPGGARKEAWHVEVKDGQGELRHLFLRYDRADPAAVGDPWTVHKEGEIYLALAPTDVPVPPVVAVHPTDQALLEGRIEGENWFARLQDEGARLAIAREFMRHLAALHRLDPAQLDLPSFPAVTTVPDLVRRQLDELEAILAFRGGKVEPGLVFTLRWLREHVPAYEGPVVLVQGDTGPGNFMYQDGRITAIVDWELAHLGDPMDDLAWLSLRATQEPFTHLPDRVREYVDLSGHALDLDRVRYYRVLAEAKLRVMSHGRQVGAADDGGGGADLGTRLIYTTLHMRLWMEALGDVLGERFEPPALPPVPEPTETDALYDNVLGQLREVIVPRIDDPFAATRAKGVARLLKYLAGVSRQGGGFERQELDELADALGARPASVVAGRAEIDRAFEEGRLEPAAYLGLLAKRIFRQNELLRPASGVLADRHWPALV